MDSYMVLSDNKICWDGAGYGQAVEAFSAECKRLANDGWTIETGIASRDNLSAARATKDGKSRDIEIIRDDPELTDLPDFPQCLRIIRVEPNSRILDPAAGHNLVIGSWVMEHQGMTGLSLLTTDERAILALAAGLDSWCRYKREDAASPFGSEEVTKPLYRAFFEALNHETGRLDCRTLSDWANQLMQALNIDCT